LRKPAESLSDSQLKRQTTGPYRNKEFYAKEWLFSKLVEFLRPVETSAETKPNCLVLLGDPGTGKSHLACELKWPTSPASALQHLAKQTLSVYFLSWLTPAQNTVQHLAAHLAKSIHKLNPSPKTTPPPDLADKCSQFLTEDQVIQIGDRFSAECLKPLKNLSWPNDQTTAYFILIDGIDEAFLTERLAKAEDQRSTTLPAFSHSTSTLLDPPQALLLFLNTITAHFPAWLKLVLTARRCTEKSHIKRLLTSVKYDKLSLDRQVTVASVLTTTQRQCLVEPSNSSHSLQALQAQTKQANRMSTPVELCNAAHFTNLKDIQAYILKRLDKDTFLKKKFPKESAVELINLLLTKSNFCLLYVERVLDLVLSGYMAAVEIRAVPATLNGFYLHLMRRIITETTAVGQQTSRDLLYALLGVCIAEARPFDSTSLFTKLCARFPHLQLEAFESLFEQIAPLLFSELPPGRWVLCHASLADWLTDVKFCTQSYLVSLAEAHLLLALVCRDDGGQAAKFRWHLERAGTAVSGREVGYLRALYEREPLKGEEKLGAKRKVDAIDFGKIFSDLHGNHG